MRMYVRQILVLSIILASVAVTQFAFAENNGTEVSGAENNGAETKKIENRLYESVKYLASDDLEGRGIGTKGLNLAADFIAKEFSNLGLQTTVLEGQPFQKFNMVYKVEMGPDTNNRLVFVGNKEDESSPEMKLGVDFNPLALGGSAKISAEVVFAGYGITAKEHNYDDYAGIDVAGKLVVVIRKEPQQDNPHSAFNGNRASRYATFQSKVSNAYEHGAAGVVIVNDLYSVQEQRESTAKRFDEAVVKLVEAQQAKAKADSERKTGEGTGSATEGKADQQTTGSDDSKRQAEYQEQITSLADQISTLGKRLKEDQFDRVLGFREAGDSSSSRKMPVFFVSRAKLDPIIKSTRGKDLASLEKEIDEGPTPKSKLLEGWRVDCESQLITHEAEVKNVIGVLPGEGPLADQTIIVGAHYDHLGMGGSGNSLAPGTIAVHNGADDNASGTASLLEIARQLSTRGSKPKRRIVFIAFTGEESGLEGSILYVKQPLFPLEHTIAMVNLDMVGRMNDNKLIVHGTGTAKEFDALVDELNKRHELSITKDPSGYGPSDHESFYVKSIPVFHLFTGTHNDYHRPSDDIERINVVGMRRISSFATDLVAAIDSRDDKPTYQETKRPNRDRGGSRPYLGSIPDFSKKVEGYALMGVQPGSPADKAGIRAGDVIIRLGDSKIGGLDDIDSALRKYKAGDTVKVVVMRGEEMKTLDVTLGAPSP